MKRFEFCFGVLDFEGNNECRPRYFLHSKRRTQVLFLFSMRIFHPLDLFILAMDFGPWVTYIAIIARHFFTRDSSAWVLLPPLWLGSKWATLRPAQFCAAEQTNRRQEAEAAMKRKPLAPERKCSKMWVFPKMVVPPNHPF